MAAEPSDVSELELIELERARIGHEIHDTLLPLVFAASASLHGLLEQGLLEQDAEAVKNPGQVLGSDHSQRERLVQIAGWLSDALQVGRKLLVEIYPPELQGHSWQSAVRDTLSRLTDSCCEVEWDIDPELDRQPAILLSASYRIVIEAVRNAIRHGKASKITITAQPDLLQRGSAEWSIEVIDNGAGFDTTNIPSDRFGVRSMIGRAKLAGGSCSVDSQIGGPTSVTLRWNSQTSSTTKR